MHTAHATPPEIGGFHHRTLETQNQALSRLSALGPSVTTGGPANRPQSVMTFAHEPVLLGFFKHFLFVRQVDYSNENGIAGSNVERAVPDAADG